MASRSNTRGLAHHGGEPAHFGAERERQQRGPSGCSRRFLAPAAPDDGRQQLVAFNTAWRGRGGLEPRAIYVNGEQRRQPVRNARSWLMRGHYIYDEDHRSVTLQSWNPDHLALMVAPDYQSHPPWHAQQELPAQGTLLRRQLALVDRVTTANTGGPPAVNRNERRAMNRGPMVDYHRYVREEQGLPQLPDNDRYPRFVAHEITELGNTRDAAMGRQLERFWWGTNATVPTVARGVDVDAIDQLPPIPSYSVFPGNWRISQQPSPQPQAVITAPASSSQQAPNGSTACNYPPVLRSAAGVASRTSSAFQGQHGAWQQGQVRMPTSFTGRQVSVGAPAAAGTQWRQQRGGSKGSKPSRRAGAGRGRGRDVGGAF